MKRVNLTKSFLAASIYLILSACSGGGGGGPTNIGSTGSAIFSGLSQGSASNVCFSTAAIGTAANCSVSGTPTNQTSLATCSTGTPAAVCNVGGVRYALITGGSSSADLACVAAGGTVQVSCPILTNGACTGAGGAWTAANNPDVSNSINCSNAGGVFYTTLQNLTGSMPGASLSTGNNIISADPNEVATALGLFNGASDLDSTNISLVAIYATATIGNYWDHSFFMSSPSVYNFQSTAVELSAGASISTSGFITIKSNSAIVYYQ